MGLSGWFDRQDAVVWGLAMAYIIACPYTKVEESFNVQAVHDILYHGRSLTQYDHFDFPGVVPRTFVGAVALAILSYPFVLVSSVLGLSRCSTLYVVRSVLALITVLSIGAFRRAISRRMRDKSLGIWLTLITCCQFHILFYSSRFLPNTYSLIMTNLAHAAWLSDRYSTSLVLFAFNSVVFRSDGIVFAFPQIVLFLARGKMSIRHVMVLGFIATVVSIAVTVAIDSVFWQRLIWPELSVFLFNVVENKSSQWGTYPFFSYFTRFLPRAMLIPIVFIPFGLLTVLPTISALRNAKLQLQFDANAIDVALPALMSVFLYSFLPHKEIRFLFPILVPLNSVAAMGIIRFNRFLVKQNRTPFFDAALSMPLFLSFIASSAFLYASSHNYPGGYAFDAVHQLAAQNNTVFIGNLAAITGVSRFGERPDLAIAYDKTEGLSNDDLIQKQYDFLLHEHPVPNYQTLRVFTGFGGFNLRSLPPKLIQIPQVYLLGKPERPAKPQTVVEVVANLIHSSKIVIFSKSYCPYCMRVKKLLNSLAVEFVSVELDKIEDGANVQRELQRITGRRTVPNVFIYGESVGGSDDVHELHAKQKLLPLIESHQ